MHRVFVTVDVDWAPDWAMAELLEYLLERGVRSTWFVTHETSILGELRAYPDLVELGIHPNFLPDSSHGDNARAVIESCMALVPEATTMRTHCLVQSTPIFQEVVDVSPITIDVSLYARGLRSVGASLLPLARERSITRLPYVWEDDLEFFSPDPQWDGRVFLRGRSHADEVTVVDLHPIHFALNSASEANYLELKRIHGVRHVSKADAAPFVNSEVGAASFVESLTSMRGDYEFNAPLSGMGFERTDG